MTGVIVSLITSVVIPILGVLIKEWATNLSNETSAERKQNEINKAIVKHDADVVNAAIADRLRNVRK